MKDYSKNASESELYEELDSIAHTHITFAVVCRGPLRSFREAIARLHNLPDVYIVYEKASLGKIWLINGEAMPEGGKDDVRK